ncbi:MAG TPA: Maf family protein [Candidatus Kryptonia bacterium]|nr:Maf family protein [Candidatus Kryptonia bacterium]
MTPSLVLASASPRRRELLAQLGLDFEVMPSDVPERPRPSETADEFAARIAREKALHVAAQRRHQWVLAADTVVVVDGELLGKPCDRDDARRMLRLLSGRTHRVLTAVTLLAPGGASAGDVVIETKVRFRRVRDQEIEAYLNTDEPFDKAGAYAVQGRAAEFVAAIEGSYTNVVGLPLDEVAELCRRHGVLAAMPRVGTST